MGREQQRPVTHAVDTLLSSPVRESQVTNNRNLLQPSSRQTRTPWKGPGADGLPEGLQPEGDHGQATKSVFLHLPVSASVWSTLVLSDAASPGLAWPLLDSAFLSAALHSVLWSAPDET